MIIKHFSNFFSNYANKQLYLFIEFRFYFKHFFVETRQQFRVNLFLQINSVFYFFNRFTVPFERRDKNKLYFLLFQIISFLYYFNEPHSSFYFLSFEITNIQRLIQQKNSYFYCISMQISEKQNQIKLDFTYLNSYENFILTLWDFQK